MSWSAAFLTTNYTAEGQHFSRLEPGADQHTMRFVPKRKERRMDRNRRQAIQDQRWYESVNRQWEMLLKSLSKD